MKRNPNDSARGATVARPGLGSRRDGKPNDSTLRPAPGRLSERRRALILQYEPVARAVAASVFKSCRGYCDRLGMEGKGPGGLLPFLQAEAMYEMTEAATRFNFNRRNPKTGEPVSFAPYARSSVKWALHHLIRGGRKPEPWTDEIDPNRADYEDEAAPLEDALDAGRVRARLASLPPYLRRAAGRAEAGEDVDPWALAELRAALTDLREENTVHHPQETRDRARALFSEGKTAREVMAELVEVPLGTLSAWRATWARMPTPPPAPAVTASPPPAGPTPRPAPSAFDAPAKAPAAVHAAPPAEPVAPASPPAPAESTPPAAEASQAQLLLPGATAPAEATKRRRRGLAVELALDVEGIGRIYVPATIVRCVYTGGTR